MTGTVTLHSNGTRRGKRLFNRTFIVCSLHRIAMDDIQRVKGSRSKHGCSDVFQVFVCLAINIWFPVHMWLFAIPLPIIPE